MAMQKKVLGTKFNLCAKLIILCRRLCYQSQNNLAKSRHQYESVLQVIDDYETKLNWDGLTFTPDYFKAKKKDCLGLAAKSNLRQAPGLRKKEEIEKLLIALRNIPAFTEYPIKMQNELCKVGLFLEYEEKRVIIREGHRAHYFYIILSGTVVVTVFDESTGSSSTLVTLESGMSFGELGLISHSKRQASVVCKTDVELLSITYSEYQEIFMSGGIVKLDNAEHFEFLSDTMIALDLAVCTEPSPEREVTKDDLLYISRSLQFLRHWPVEKLKENPTVSCIYYFHRNTVLVRDSNNSDWIYVVLKGSLSVLKKLKNFTNKSEKDQRTPRTKGDQDVQIDDKLATKYTENSFTQRKRRPGQWKGQSLDLPVGPEEQFKSSVELESKLSQTLPGYVNYKDRLLSLDYEKIIKSYQSRLLTKGTQQANFWKQDSAEKWLKQKKNNLSKVPQKHANISESDKTRTSGFERVTFPDIEVTNKVVQYQKTESNDDKYTDIGTDCLETNKQEIQNVDNNELVENTLTDNEQENKKMKKIGIMKSLKGAYLAPSRDSRHEAKEEETLTSDEALPDIISDEKEPEKELTLSQKLANLQMRYQLAAIGREGRRTIAEELDQKGRRDYKVTEADIDPMFIQLQVLERGQCFGVVQLVFQDEPSLSVVSNGAECLVISKKLFRTWASEKCWRHLRQTECPYPTDEELKRKLVDVLQWQRTSSSIYNEIQAGVLLKKSRQKHLLPAYLGQK